MQTGATAKSATVSSTGAEFGSASAHQSALQQLHWLPVKHRVTFNTAALNAPYLIHKRCPSYLADLVTFNTTDAQRRQLRSSTTTRAAAVRTQFGKRAFFLFAVLRCGIVSLLHHHHHHHHVFY